MRRFKRRITLNLPPDLQPVTNAEAERLEPRMAGWANAHEDLALNIAGGGVVDIELLEFASTCRLREVPLRPHEVPAEARGIEQLTISRYERRWFAVFRVTIEQNTTPTAAGTPSRDDGEAVRRSGRLD